MTPDLIFQLSCLLTAIGWVILFFFSPFWRGWDKVTVGIVVLIPALVYTYLNASNFSLSNIKNFSSLSGVKIVFSNPYLLTAAWAHFLAMDLMVAVWIKKNSVKLGIAHWKILISLFFTCLLGPFGWVLYLLTRWIVTKKYFSENVC
jgi:hypothetical protein